MFVAELSNRRRTSVPTRTGPLVGAIKVPEKASERMDGGRSGKCRGLCGALSSHAPLGEVLVVPSECSVNNRLPFSVRLINFSLFLNICFLCFPLIYSQFLFVSIHWYFYSSKYISY